MDYRYDDDDSAVPIRYFDDMYVFQFSLKFNANILYNIDTNI